jgi:hypothetical protein
MSEHQRDYAAIRRSVEHEVNRQKWTYRSIFFGMHLLFFAVAMFAVWGTVIADASLRSALFDQGSGGALIVILPTILWVAVLLFHAAALFTETAASEKVMRERLIMRELGEDILQRGLEDQGVFEKPKRRPSASDAVRVQFSEDGELIPLEEIERLEQSDYARSKRAGES